MDDVTARTSVPPAAASRAAAAAVSVIVAVVFGLTRRIFKP